MISPHLLKVDAYAFASGGFGDVFRGSFKGSDVCVKRLRVATPKDIAVSYQHRYSSCAYLRTNQKLFCKEAITWKSFEHPNILPLIGATISPSQLVSPLMPAGDVSKYIPKNPDADRLVLVGVDLLAPPRFARFSFQ
jgi:hypothetical protein